MALLSITPNNWSYTSGYNFFATTPVGDSLEQLNKIALTGNYGTTSRINSNSSYESPNVTSSGGFYRGSFGSQTYVTLTNGLG